VTIACLRELAKLHIQKCECCGGSIKVYRSPLGVTTRVLIWMAGQSEEDEWLHIPSAPPGVIAGGGDYAKLRYWNLIRQHPENPDPKKRAAGLWKLTKFGRGFAHNQFTASSHCFWQLWVFHSSFFLLEDLRGEALEGDYEDQLDALENIPS